ncbi:MAG: Trk system potassium transporter TrkA [Arenicella sp.]|nr:Trk system potassium transporter TrkA [Arenicella sp.]
MKILILGASQVGISIAEVLVGEENDVTIVDIRNRPLQQLQNRLDIRTVTGNAAHPSVLRAAGAEDASLVLAVTDNDEVNMVACQIAEAFFATPTKIARIRSSEYLNNLELFENEAGFQIDVIISPEGIVKDHIIRLIEFPGAIQVLDFADGLVQLVGVKAVAGGALINCQLAELDEHMPNVETRVAAIYRDKDVITPTSETVIREEDEVFFVAARKHIKAVMQEMRGHSDKTRRIFIAGGGNIGLNLAKELDRKGYSVKLIELDPQRAERIADAVRHVIVLNGDAADANLLLQENIEGADVFCAVTEIDEINILAAKLANKLGARRVMALVNRPAYIEHIDHPDIDVLISPPGATIGSVLAHIRRGDVVSVHALRGGRAEAIEAIAHGDEASSKVIGRGVRDIPFPPGTGVGAIVRAGEVIIPSVSTIIEPEDHVIIFMDDKSCIQHVEALFQVDATFI